MELQSGGCQALCLQGASQVRLDDDFTHQQMQQRKGLSADFLCLKTRGYKPFFRAAILKYKDGPVVRTCVRGEANNAVPSGTLQASAQAPPAPVRPPAGQAQASA